MQDWYLHSWKNFESKHQPKYSDQVLLQSVLQKISNLPPLVSIGEIENLSEQIAEAQDGKKFILQGGDCAERFIDSNSTAIQNKLKILLQMSIILTYRTRRSVVRLGRMAGQYAKPRSQEYETVSGERIFSYFGDAVNGIAADKESRNPDPERLLDAYFYAATTLNYIRAIISGGFADLHNPYHWNLYQIEKTEAWPIYKQNLDNILDAISFMESIDGARNEILQKVDFFTSHEGLLLDYETSLSRLDASSDFYYNTGAHLLWIGERTRFLDGAHVEYFRGIRNPIGIKIGNTISDEELVELVKKINPENKKGRILLISRMGADLVDKVLPGLIQAMQKAKLNATWSCDPMHANMVKTESGLKTRKFEDILTEIKKTFSIHKEKASCLGGLHFELTGDDVTECLGGAVNLKSEDLDTNYQSYCDPRLNYAQSMEMAFLVADLLKK